MGFNVDDKLEKGYTIRVNEDKGTSMLIMGNKHITINCPDIVAEIPEDATFEKAVARFAKKAQENGLTITASPNLLRSTTATGLTYAGYMITDADKCRVYDSTSQVVSSGHMAECISKCLDDKYELPEGMNQFGESIIRLYANGSTTKYEQITIRNIGAEDRCVATYTDFDGVSVESNVINKKGLELYKELVDKIKSEKVLHADDIFKFAVDQGSQEKYSPKEIKPEDIDIEKARDEYNARVAEAFRKHEKDKEKSQGGPVLGE